jgi:hypothetical protein
LERLGIGNLMAARPGLQIRHGGGCLGINGLNVRLEGLKLQKFFKNFLNSIYGN